MSTEVFNDALPESEELAVCLLKAGRADPDNTTTASLLHLPDLVSRGRPDEAPVQSLAQHILQGVLKSRGSMQQSLLCTADPVAESALPPEGLCCTLGFSSCGPLQDLLCHTLCFGPWSGLLL